MRVIPIALAALILLFACRSKTRNYGDHISPKTMENILLDINMAEAYSLMVKDSLHKGGSKNSDSLAAYYKYIFDHYHITNEEFNENYDWYKSHPEDLDSIYTAMIPVITRWQQAPVKKDTSSVKK